MYLKSLKIANFRKIVGMECQFGPGLNLIVGPNDSGKTAVIDAIRFAFRQIVDDYSRITEEDFGNPDREINIDSVFSFDDCKTEVELADQMGVFAEYLSFDAGDRPEVKIWYSVKSGENEIRYPSFRVGPSKEVAAEMDVRCRDNLRVVYLRPLRDAEGELRAKAGSRISKILSKHSDITANEKELIKFLADFKDSSESFFKTGNGKRIRAEIDALLQSFDEQASSHKKEITLGPTESLTSSKALEKLALYYENLIKPGLGTLNMMFIAAELLHLRTQRVPRTLLVEEVEAHLHPQRQLKIIKSLEDKSKEGIGVQMILTTHSPNLSSIVEVSRLNICHEGEMFSLAMGNTKLDRQDYKYLERFLDATKANLFFAQGVILVEGPSEQFLVPELIKIALDYDLADYGVSVVSTNGLGFDHFINIFKRSGEPYNLVPVAVVTDADLKIEERISAYVEKINDNNNKISCFVGSQLATAKQLARGNGTTLEKLILANTTILKNLYIEAYNKFKKKKSAELRGDMDVSFLYSRIEKNKARLAQEVAIEIQQLNSAQKTLLKQEINTSLKYIIDAAAYVLLKEPKEITE